MARSKGWHLLEGRSGGGCLTFERDTKDTQLQAESERKNPATQPRHPGGQLQGDNEPCARCCVFYRSWCSGVCAFLSAKQA